MIFDTNNDCTILAIQKPMNEGGYEFKIIDHLGNQLGNSIESDNGNDIVLNGDGTIMALTKKGSCEAYRYQDGSWVKYGNTMFTNSADANVNKICINNAGDIVVILGCSDEPGSLISMDIPLIDSEGQDIVTGLTYQPPSRSIYNNFDFSHLTVVGGSGTGATATVTLIKSGDDEVVSNIEIVEGGSGYLTDDILSIDGSGLDRVIEGSPLRVGAELVHLIMEGKQGGSFDQAGTYTDVPLYKVTGIFWNDTGARVTVTIAAVVGVTSIIVTGVGDALMGGTFITGSILQIAFSSINRFTDQNGDGQHDDGEDYGDSVKITLLPDAIDNPNNITFQLNQNNINTSGEIQTFQYMAGEWNSFGEPGEAFQANSVDNITSLSLNSTGDILAIGKPSGTEINPCGEVVVYTKTSDNWGLKGLAMTLSSSERLGIFPDKIRFGYNIELNKDGTIICISSNWGKNIAGYDIFSKKRTGVIVVYQWLNERWQKLGGTIDLNEENLQLGYKIDINDAETDIILTTLTNKWDYATSTSTNPDQGDPDRERDDKKEQKLITFKYDTSIDAGVIANDSSKILFWNQEIMPEVLIDGSGSHEANIKISSLGHKICYFYKRTTLGVPITYNFLIQNWPAATIQDTVTSTDILTNEIKTTSDVTVEGTMTAGFFSGDGSNLINIPTTGVNGLSALVADLPTTYAPIASPTFTGTVTIPDLKLTGTLYESDGTTPKIFSNWINVGDDITRDSNVTVTGNLQLNGTLKDENGAARIFSNWTIDGNDLIRNSNVTVTGDLQLNGTLKDENGAARIFSNWTIDGNDLIRNSNVTVTGDLHILEGNVGIGTTSPGDLLHIEDGELETRLRIKNTHGTTGSSVIRMQTANDLNSVIWQDDSTKFVVRASGGIPLHLGANSNNDHMVINTSGNVGIGTTSPGAKLEIKGDSNDYGGILLFQNDTHTDRPALWNPGTDTSTHDYEIVGRSAGNNSFGFLRIMAGGGNAHNSRIELTAYTGNNNGKNIAFFTNDTQQMILDENGNVGIGTDDPGALLDVAGEVRGHYNQNTKSYFGRCYVGYSGDNNYAGFGHLNEGLGTTGYAIRQYYSGSTDVNAMTDCPLTFRIGNAEHMRLHTDGNVGIGTTSPEEKLQVEGTSTTRVFIKSSGTGNSGLELESNGQKSWIQQKSDGNIDFMVNNASSQNWCFHNGNVGIGTDDPDAKLDVNGSIRAGYDTDTNSYFGRTWIGVVGGLSNHAGIGHVDKNGNSEYALMQSNLGKTFLGSVAGQSIGFRQGNNDRMTLASNGVLQIESYIEHIGDDNTYFGFNANDNFNVRCGGNMGISVVGTGYVQLAGASNSGWPVSLPTGGTYSHGTVNASTLITRADLTVAGYMVHNGDTNTKIGFPANDNIYMYCNNSLSMRLNANGVGIHTDAPSNSSYRLKVGGGMYVNGTINTTSLTCSNTITGSVNGNAASVTIHSTNTSDVNYYPTFTETSAGAGAIRTDNSDLFYNPNSNTMTAGNFYGKIKMTDRGDITDYNYQVMFGVPQANGCGELYWDGDMYYNANTNILTAPKFSGDGSQLTNLPITPISGAASTIEVSNLTGSMALVSNSSGKVAAHSTVSSTELGYLNGVTSAIQTQLNTKATSTTVDAAISAAEWDSTTNGQVKSLGVGTPASGSTGDFRATGNITAYYSDARLKDFMGTIPEPLIKINKLNGYYFKENALAKSLGYNNNKLQVGVSAQEVESVLPEIVTEAPIDNKYKTVWYNKLVPLLIEGIKTLTDENNILKEQLKNVLERLAVLESK